VSRIHLVGNCSTVVIAYPLMLKTEFFGTPSESLRFYDKLGSRETRTKDLLPCVTLIAIAKVRTRLASIVVARGTEQCTANLEKCNT